MKAEKARGLSSGFINLRSKMEPTAIPSFTGLAGGQEGDVYERRLGHSVTRTVPRICFKEGYFPNCILAADKKSPSKPRDDLLKRQ